MTTVLLVIHLMIAAALVGIVLVQRSEGGALGIGGGGGGGFMTGRSAANLLTRITAFLAVAFFGTSILLAIMASRQSTPSSIVDRGSQTEGSETPADGGTPSSLPKLAPIVPPSSGGNTGPQVPQSQ